MSDKPISVGDLVMVVKRSSCDGNMWRVGHTFKVESINLTDCPVCRFCGGRHHTMVTASDGEFAWNISRLKRIDPPAEPEHTETEVTLCTTL